MAASSINAEVDSKNVLVKTTDNEFFLVAKDLVMRSQVLSNLIESGGSGAGQFVPLEMEAKTLRHILRWMQYHKKIEDAIKDCTENSLKNRRLKALAKWEEDFFDISDSEIVKITLAADYLNETTLYDAATTHIAHVIEHANMKELRKRFIKPPAKK